MNVLSLFDGMSCGRQALDRSGFKVDKYFASEIDKYAIQVAMANYPDTIQLGSVTQVSAKCFHLSEVYSYVCKKYFNDDLHSIQSIISEQELLYRIDQEQSFAAYFGTQIKDEESEASEHSTISINDRVWFFKNPMDCNGGVYDIIRGGERRAKPNRLNFDSLLEHSFWWNGNGQQKSIVKTESIEGVNRESSIGGNQIEIEGGYDKTISIERSKRTSKEENIRAICGQRKEGDSPKSNGGLRSNINGDKKERNGEEETRINFYTTKEGVPASYENNSIKQDSGSFGKLYKEVQATVVECEWGIIIFKGAINICCGGSPCQSFSFAGKRKGMSTKCEQEILTLEHYLELKKDGFEFEGQSYLFWEFMRLLNEVKPKYFLLENVEMGEKWEKVLRHAIQVPALHINSALVSAQNRKRVYFTNIGMQPMGLFGDLESIIQQPKDKGILLKDILESDVDEKYFLSEKALDGIMKHKQEQKGFGFGAVIKDENEKMNSLKIGGKGVDDLVKVGQVGFKKEFVESDKAQALLQRDYKGMSNYGINVVVHNTQKRSADRPSIQKNKNAGGSGHLSREDGKTYCLDTACTMAVEIVAMRGRPNKDGINIQQLEANGTGKSNTLTSVQKDNLVISSAVGERKVNQVNTNNKSNGGTQPYQQDRIYDVNGISPALQAQLSSGSAIINTPRIRRLTPLECKRLQTVDDNYLMPVSDTQIYKQLGNGWTIDVIAHIFSYMKF